METETKTAKEANLIPFKKGESGNPNGRPLGQRNYSTIRRIAFERIGKLKNMTAEEVEEEMVKGGLEKALQADAKFYQDDLDRAYGRPKQDVGLSGTGENGAISIEIKMI